MNTTTTEAFGETLRPYLTDTPTTETVTAAVLAWFDAASVEVEESNRRIERIMPEILDWLSGTYDEFRAEAAA